MNIFQILEVHNNNNNNNYRKPMFSVAFMCKLLAKVTKLNASISVEDRLSIHVYSTSAFLMNMPSMCDIVHNGPGDVGFM
jgi:hypothetical protein